MTSLASNVIYRQIVMFVRIVFIYCMNWLYARLCRFFQCTVDGNEFGHLKLMEISFYVFMFICCMLHVFNV